MPPKTPDGNMVETIRRIYRSDAANADRQIEEYLEQELADLPPQKQLAFLEKIESQFAIDTVQGSDSTIDKEMVSRVCSLLLGKKVSSEELSSVDLIEKLSVSLNTVFDTLNEMIRVINQTLFSRAEGEETIRQIIGHNMSSDVPEEPLEKYLGQIHKAFLVTHRAFKAAAISKVTELLAELDPDKIESNVGGIKLGIQRRADSFNVYRKKFQMCKDWLESGGFIKAYLDEFERNCHKMSLE